MLKLARRLAVSALLTACSVSPSFAQAPAISTEPIPFDADAPFASEIYTFFVQDELYPPTACRTVFTGSSSIRFWLGLEEDFPAHEPLNRGFGGSQITEVIGYFDILLTRHQPREIIFYAGENDLNAGASPADVAARFEAFMGVKDQRLGDTPVYFLSVKPSFARLGELAAQTETNALIQAYAETREDLIYVDIASPMMDGKVPKKIFISDQLHMNLDGYAIWTDALDPLLNRPDRRVRSGC
ncbi:MAG: GDSL-type esterase/lipase family protein [Hyphomonas sp.]|nr:GDSL-type esterase/lipase family protein [Hyphomonas sp.]